MVCTGRPHRQTWAGIGDSSPQHLHSDHDRRPSSARSNGHSSRFRVAGDGACTIARLTTRNRYAITGITYRRLARQSFRQFEPALRQEILHVRACPARCWGFRLHIGAHCSPGARDRTASRNAKRTFRSKPRAEHVHAGDRTRCEEAYMQQPALCRGCRPQLRVEVPRVVQRPRQDPRCHSDSEVRHLH